MTPEREEKEVLAIRHATVRYLDNVLFPSLTFVLHAGQQWAVIGKSGGGKTALLQTILGKYNLAHGSLQYHFPEISPETEGRPLHPRDRIALVVQQPHFRNKQNLSDFYYQQRFNASYSEEAVTVREYLEEAIAKTAPQTDIRFSMDWVVTNLRLTHLLDKSLIKLSNGETRRLLFAEALLKQPLLLLLDNPFTGLDKSTRPFFHDLLARIAERGTQLMLVTSPSEIPACVTHVLELEAGEIKNTWTAEEYAANSAAGQDRWQPDPEKLKTINQLSGPPDGGFETAVRLEAVHVQYGETTILDQVNWKVTKGEKWALLGPNGAGKSTLLSLLSGDNPQAYANRIYLFDRRRGSGESIWEIKHQIGFLSPEMHQYFPSQSPCGDVVLSGFTDTLAVIRKRITPAQRELALAWMDLLDIADLQTTPFKHASAGRQRLILLTRALVKNPPLLILDEPCQGLDTEQKAHFKRVIETVCAAKEKTLIFVTHYAEEIPGCVNQVLRLREGRIEYSGVWTGEP